MKRIERVTRTMRHLVSSTAMLAIMLAGTDAAAADLPPIVIKTQGSFFVGGRTVQGAGVFDPTKSGATVNDGGTFWVDQMYVQYQIPYTPFGPPKPPLVLVHGGDGTGDVWESTPDGREGYQSIFLRRGFQMYLVDFPHRGRSGYPSFNGPFGQLDGVQIAPNNTSQASFQWAWTRWRFGPVYPVHFPVDQFAYGTPTPTGGTGVDNFMKALVPNVGDNNTTISNALIALFNKIGPGIIVTHSQSGLFGWLTAIGTANVRGVVSYEPGFVFPASNVPPPIPLFTGTMAAGSPVPDADFAKLARIPIQVVYGDNIPANPIPDLVADGRRAQVVASVLFQTALNNIGGNMAILHLPDVGLLGNTHFSYSDLNNIQVADQMSKFLRDQGLDK